MRRGRSCLSRFPLTLSLCLLGVAVCCGPDCGPVCDCPPERVQPTGLCLPSSLCCLAPLPFTPVEAGREKRSLSRGRAAVGLAALDVPAAPPVRSCTMSRFRPVGLPSPERSFLLYVPLLCLRFALNRFAVWPSVRPGCLSEADRACRSVFSLEGYILQSVCAVVPFAEKAHSFRSLARGRRLPPASRPGAERLRTEG